LRDFFDDPYKVELCLFVKFNSLNDYAKVPPEFIRLKEAVEGKTTIIGTIIGSE